MSQEQLITWSAYTWPEWVPEKIRKEVERFWDERSGRSPLQWMQNAVSNRVPAMGSTASLQRIKKGVKVAFTDDHYEFCMGRYVHCWNNIGRIVHEDGTFSYVAVYHADDKIEQFAQMP